MNNGRLLALSITVVTIVLVIVGTVWPIDSAASMARGRIGILPTPASPQASASNLLQEIERRNWHTAYVSLANRTEFTEAQFIRDIAGGYASLRSYATLDSFDLHPVHASADEADFTANLRWSTVVGTFHDIRQLHLVRAGDRWQVSWPVIKEPSMSPQVIPVNYLRWDVIYRGPEDDWGAQDVESPHVRIIDMHPIDRGGGVVVLGEILNEDVVPAFVTVKATLLDKSGSALATEDAFDNIAHILLPKQVSPFRIDFRSVPLTQVDSIRMAPASSLIATSADPVIEIENQRLSGLPDSSLSAQLVNQSGQVVNIARVLGTFYDSKGQLVWVSGEYADRALLPSTPVAVSISVPADLAGGISSYRVIASTYSSNRF
jgi:hypothetical protein